MLNFFIKLKNNNSGYVSVILLLLLLLPSIIIIGVMTDFTRIFAARDVVKSAVSLGTNSALAYYDGVLKENYGLFAVAQNDDDFLNDMIKSHIEDSLLVRDGSFSMIKLFRNIEVETSVSNIDLEIKDANLANPEVLRRQIQDYMKIQGAEDANKILEMTADFNKFKDNVKVIKNKLEIDLKIRELAEKCEELYERIKYNDYYLLLNSENIAGLAGLETKIVDEINESLSNIYNKLLSEDEEEISVYKLRKEWLEIKFESSLPLPSSEESEEDEGETELSEGEEESEDVGEPEEPELPEEDEETTNKLLEIDGKINDLFAEVSQEAINIKDNIITRYYDCGSLHEDEYYKNLNVDDICCLKSYISNAESIIKIVENANDLKDKANEELDNINDFDFFNCSDNLKNGISGVLEDHKSFIDSINNFDFEFVKSNVSSYIGDLNSFFDNIKSEIDYFIIDLASGPQISEIQKQESEEFQEKINSLETGLSVYVDAESVLNEIELYFNNIQYDYFWKYNYDNSGIIMQRYSQIDIACAKFYNDLSQFFCGEYDLLKDFSKKLSESGENLVSNEINFESARGAAEISDSIYSELASKAEDRINYDINVESWFGDININQEIIEKKYIDGLENLINMFDMNSSNINNNDLLLTAYCTSVFSDFATVYGEKSITGIEFNEDLNYFLDSEIEYLLFAGQESAENVSSACGLLYLTRFIDNYISSFNDNLIKLGGDSENKGVFCGLIREVARIGLVSAEAGADVFMLMQEGGKVNLLKENRADWFVMRDSGVSDFFSKDLSLIFNNEIDYFNDDYKSINIAFKIDKESEDENSSFANFADLCLLSDERNVVWIWNEEDGNIKRVSYKDYMMIYLYLFSKSDSLILRVSDLIALNMTEVYGVDFDMSKAKTYFGVRSKVEMKYIFLSDILKGININSGNFDIIEQEVRGY